MRTAIVFAVIFSLCGTSLAQTPEIRPYNGTGWFSGLKRDYLPRYVPPAEFANSNRLDALMRAGRIYLSLQDAIALALENNLDIELARWGPRIAESDQLRASAGSLLRNIDTRVNQGPSSASSGVLAGANALGSSNSNSNSDSNGQQGILSGLNVQLAGAAIPNLDPVVYANGQWYHQTSPQTSSVVTGTNFLISQYKTANFGVQQGFLTGTTVSLGMNNTLLRQNSPNNDFNPTTRTNLGVQINQHLLQGFGLAVNNRAIRIAKNNRHVSDLVFKAQVIATVSSVIGLYWDLVSLNEYLRVRQAALELNQRQYNDNKKRAQFGAIAPIDLVQAEAEVAAAQQEVTNAQTQVLQQEAILKNVLTRTGADTLSIVDARIVPTDRIPLEEQEAIRPVQDLLADAMANRPEIEISRVQLENSRISMRGTKSALLPTLDVWLALQNNALAGQVNTIPQVSPAGGLVSGGSDLSALNSSLLGGYGTVLGQLFGRHFPDYGVGFSLNIPLRNRSAQADLIRDQLNYRQQQIEDRQLQNRIRLNVINARTTLEQARAGYDAAVKARLLQEQALAGERRKYQLGTATFLNVVQAQQSLVTRQAAEVQALNIYIRAKAALEMYTGDVLKNHNISIDEAYSGVVKRAPGPLPVLETP